MTCKDCIHYDVCHRRIDRIDFLPVINGKIARSSIMFIECKDVEKHCEDFKDKTKTIKFPCKVGDTVYVIPSLTNFRLNVLHGYSDTNRVYEQEVHGIQMWKSDEWCLWTCGRISLLLQRDYKKTWFLSKEEAEKALEKLANENKNS